MANTNKPQRLLIVSNRLPFTVVEQEGVLEFQPSSGGLVSGLKGYLQRNQGEGVEQAGYIWVGWPGVSVDRLEQREDLSKRAAEEFNAYPVFVDEAEMNLFYQGFANQTIWPLFHYFPNYTTFDEASWQNYQHVNKVFADAVMQVIQPGDVVWIHDYHLMLLPLLIRERAPNAQIGFFLHIPFPAFEIFRLLPHDWRSVILEGLLGADLIGFHTYEYASYFSRSVLRVLGYESNLGRIMVGERLVQVDTFPMGIDYKTFHDAPQSDAVKQEIANLATRLSDDKVILSIDRLDYSKGIINRLQGYLMFLHERPEWHNKVVLALVVVPSRAAVEEYAETKTQIEELVGRINGQFGSITWTPILYQYRSAPFAELIALYASSDVALVTPLRDGMNLVAKEYVAAQTGTSGVLILSELTGAATELGEALMITPTSKREIAAAIQAALEMPVAEQQRRLKLMQERLESYDVVAWAEDFIEQLQAVTQAQPANQTAKLDAAAKKGLLAAFRAAEKRLIFLDYDGTLVPFAPRPELAAPDAELRDLLAQLAANPKNEVVLISGRDKDTLNAWLADLPLTLVAEHGSWIKRRAGEWRVIQPPTEDWKPQIRPLLDRYAHRLPGALVEEKTFSLAWHYRQADPELGPVRAKELLDHLTALTGNLDVRVLQGNKVLEVRPTSVSKAMVARYWELESNPGFILGLGDDWTDEDLFTALPTGAYTIKVGQGATAAGLRVASYHQVRELLADMAAQD